MGGALRPCAPSAATASWPSWWADTCARKQASTLERGGPLRTPSAILSVLQCNRQQPRRPASHCAVAPEVQRRKRSADPVASGTPAARTASGCDAARRQSHRGTREASRTQTQRLPELGVREGRTNLLHIFSCHLPARNRSHGLRSSPLCAAVGSCTGLLGKRGVERTYQCECAQHEDDSDRDDATCGSLRHVGGVPLYKNLTSTPVTSEWELRNG